MTWGDRVAIFGGADPEILKAVPSARQRFIQMALVFVSTSGLAGISMWFALTTAVLRDWPSPSRQLVAAIMAILWAGLILNIDRFLTTSMSPTDSHGKLLAKAVPRVVMAGIIGLVVSTPLVLQVFRSDIDAEMTRLQAIQSAANKDFIKKSDEQANVNKLEKEIKKQNDILSRTVSVAGAKTVKDAQDHLKSMETKLAEQTRVADQAQKLYLCERYGFTAAERRQLDDPTKCSSKPGLNGPYPEIEQDYRNQMAAKKAIEKEVKDARAAVVTARKTAKDTAAADLLVDQQKAEEALPVLYNQLTAARALLEALRTKLGETNMKDAGLLAQIKALDEVGKAAPILRWSHLLIAALFFMIEILPVVAKILISWGALSAYDEVAQLRDDEIRDRKRIQRTATRQIEEAKADTRTKAEADMRQREFEMAQETNQFVADEMEIVMRDELKLWAQRVTQDIDDRRNGYSRPTTGGASKFRRKQKSSDMDPPDDLD